MKHLTEDELIERYYGEDPSDSAQHLETCRECARDYARLKADLDEIVPVEPPYRDENYGEQVWRSLAPSMAAYPSRRAARWRFNLWLSLSAFATCALLVTAAFYAGRVWEHRQPRTPVAQAPAPAPQRVVILVLSDHLDRTERLLVELKHADADDSAIISPMRDQARTLLAANGRFREDAEKAGDPDLSAALDRLQTLLTELTSQPGGLNAAALDHLRHEMDTDRLLFEVRVLRSRIPDQHAQEKHALKGGAA